MKKITLLILTVSSFSFACVDNPQCKGSVDFESCRDKYTVYIDKKFQCIKNKKINCIKNAKNKKDLEKCDDLKNNKSLSGE